MKDTSKLQEQIKELHSLGLTDREIARKLNIKSNNVQWHRERNLKLPPNWLKINYNNQYDRIRGYIIRNLKCSAKRRNLDFNLQYTDLELPKYCPLLNIKLDYTNSFSGNNFNRATTDRIDNSKGYIKGNIIIISRLANAMKNEANFDQLELFAKNMQKIINCYKNQGALGSITDIFPDIEKLSLDS